MGLDQATMLNLLFFVCPEKTLQSSAAGLLVVPIKSWKKIGHAACVNYTLKL